MRNSRNRRRDAATRALLSAALDADVAKRFAADICKRLADSESAVDRAVVERLKVAFP